MGVLIPIKHTNDKREIRTSVKFTNAEELDEIYKSTQAEMALVYESEVFWYD